MADLGEKNLVSVHTILITEMWLGYNFLKVLIRVSKCYHIFSFRGRQSQPSCSFGKVVQFTSAPSETSFK